MVHYACTGGNVKVLQWLLEKDPTLKSKEVLNAQTKASMVLGTQGIVVAQTR